jgi:hypothetical protein
MQLPTRRVYRAPEALRGARRSSPLRDANQFSLLEKVGPLITRANKGLG